MHSTRRHPRVPSRSKWLYGGGAALLLAGAWFIFARGTSEAPVTPAASAEPVGRVSAVAAPAPAAPVAEAPAPEAAPAAAAPAAPAEAPAAEPAVPAEPEPAAVAEAAPAAAADGRVLPVADQIRYSGSPIDEAAVLGVLNGRAVVDGLDNCYGLALKRKPKLRGRLVLGWTVKPQGNPLWVSREAGPIKDGILSACMGRVIQKQRFPKPRGGAAKVRAPFEFTP